MSHPYTIRKRFHFHAAHRNEDLEGDRCFSIHGHTYYIDLHFSFKKTDDSSVTMLFSDIESHILPIIEPFEHSFIINKDDPLYAVLKDFGIKLCVLDYPSSAENLARMFFERIRAATKLDLLRVRQICRDMKSTPTTTPATTTASTPPPATPTPTKVVAKGKAKLNLKVKVKHKVKKNVKVKKKP